MAGSCWAPISVRDGRTLTALPTRDAMLPILARSVRGAASRAVSFRSCSPRLPPPLQPRAPCCAISRVTTGRRIVEAALRSRRTASRSTLEQLLHSRAGFSAIDGIDYTDGVRICFTNGEVAHFRPSGNADEFRVYAVADTQKREPTQSWKSASPNRTAYPGARAAALSGDASYCDRFRRMQSTRRTFVTGLAAPLILGAAEQVRQRRSCGRLRRPHL